MATEAPPSPAPQSGAAPAQTPRDLKVFVGNIPHSMTEKQLQQLFAEEGAKPKVKITRRGRALATFKTAADAAHVIATFDNRVVEGSQIKVAKALPLAPRPAQENAGGDPTQPKKTKRRVRKKRTPATAADGDASLATGGETNGAGDGWPISPDDAPSQASPTSANGTNGKRAKPRKHKKPTALKPEKVTSSVKIHVGNIPKSWTADTLRNAFQALKPVSVDISTWPDGQCKGFGFIEFPSPEVQAEALEMSIPLPDYQSGDNVTLDGPDPKFLKLSKAIDRPKHRPKGNNNKEATQTVVGEEQSGQENAAKTEVKEGETPVQAQSTTA